MYYILNTSSSRERIGFVRKKKKISTTDTRDISASRRISSRNQFARSPMEWISEREQLQAYSKRRTYTWKKREEIWRMTDPLETSEEPWHCRASFRYRYTDRSIGGERSVQFNFPPRHAERGILWILSRNRIMPNTSVPSDFAPLTRNIRKSRSRPPFNEPINSTYGSTILP